MATPMSLYGPEFRAAVLYVVTKTISGELRAHHYRGTHGIRDDNRFVQIYGVVPRSTLMWQLKSRPHLKQYSRKQLDAALTRMVAEGYLHAAPLSTFNKLDVATGLCYWPAQQSCRSA